MKTYLNRILAGLFAAALPTFALAEDAGVPAGFVEVSDNVTSDNLRLHTVQRKEFSDGGRHEVVLYPGIVQLNTKFTSHAGFGAQYVYHLHENFALQAMGQYFWHNQQVGFVGDLNTRAQLTPEAATALTLQWAATGGFEVAPIYGKFSFYEGAIGHFSIVLSGGAGVGGTRIQLQDNPEPTFGDTGMKFVGQVGAGFRVRLNENLLVRLEFRDLVYTAKVDRINGCSAADLDAINRGSGSVTGSCKEEKFSGSDANAQKTIAGELVKQPSSDVLNNLGVYGGVSYTF
ncbi:outer membrane beta-barrel domain-containing protein [Vulgatibacter incomptus]|uniref:Outer membrane beta-barrel domain-containing protein n=1 Tax=Vulgatibacter incomptus TaxID=1391653 RepID=A0A0K1PAJ7_9BACT|nr:outer membrane beta-barrel domain-containing protein [Vulgatibacter incomptus]AKU90563.1 hypothetical protein AKJ08_0950 [Vulgatibacter incomptus]